MSDSLRKFEAYLKNCCVHQQGIDQLVCRQCAEMFIESEINQARLDTIEAMRVDLKDEIGFEIEAKPWKALMKVLGKHKGLEAQLSSVQQEAPKPQLEAEAALERDRTKVAECVTAVKKELRAYDWLIEGRGSYEWNDDRWHDEFKRASEAVAKAIEPMVRIAADWTNCPKTDEAVKAARGAQSQLVAWRRCGKRAPIE